MKVVFLFLCIFLLFFQKSSGNPSHKLRNGNNKQSREYRSNWRDMNWLKNYLYNNDFDKDCDDCDGNNCNDGNYNYGNCNNNGNFNNSVDFPSGSGIELKEEFNLMSARRPLDFGNPDVFARRERPCRNFDLFCIRNYLARHGRCKIRTGPAPDPAFRAQSVVYFPRSNMSSVLNEISISGLNGRITEFYVDKVTDKLVISIDFPDLTIIAKYMNIRFSRPKQEPILTEGLGAIRYSSVTITSIIPKLDDLQLDRTEFYVFVNDAAPLFYLAPTLIPQDPGALAQLAALLADRNANLREAFLTDGSFYPASFIQYNLCDFGLKVL